MSWVFNASGGSGERKDRKSPAEIDEMRFGLVERKHRGLLSRSNCLGSFASGLKTSSADNASGKMPPGVQTCGGV